MLQSPRYLITPDNDNFTNTKRKFSTSFSSLVTSNLDSKVTSVRSNSLTPSSSPGNKIHSAKVKNQDVSVCYPPYRSLLSPNIKFDYNLKANVETSSQNHHHNHSQDLNQILVKGSPTKGKYGKEYRSLLSMDASTETSSIKSFKSQRSIFSLSKRGPPTFLSLPDEVLLLIFENVLKQSPKSLIYLLYVSKRISVLAKRILYSCPMLTSTYRLGQFVHTINMNSSLALMVKSLDLSKLYPGIDCVKYQEYLSTPFYVTELNSEDSTWEDEDALAGWRDWKYRNHALYGKVDLIPISDSSSSSSITTKQLSKSTDELSAFVSKAAKIERRRKNSLPSNSVYNSNELTMKTPYYERRAKKLKDAKSFKSGKNNGNNGLSKKSNQLNPPNSFNNNTHEITIETRFPFSTNHPLQNKFLKRFSLTKDVPIGYILHLLRECKNLQDVNFKGLSISSDYKITDYETFNYETMIGKVKVKKPVYPDGLPFESLLIDETTEEQKESERIYYEKYKVTKPIYLSETNRDIEWKNLGVNFIKMDYTDVLKELTNLKYLKTLSLTSLVWINKSNIKDFLIQSKSVKSKELLWMDFTDSGMRKSSEWATKKTVKEWKKFFKDSNN